MLKYIETMHTTTVTPTPSCPYAPPPAVEDNHVNLPHSLPLASCPAQKRGYAPANGTNINTIPLGLQVKPRRSRPLFPSCRTILPRLTTTAVVTGIN